MRLFPGASATPLAQDMPVDEGHGRIETRIASLSSDLGWLPEVHHWPGLPAVGRVTAVRQRDGAVCERNRCYLPSEAFSVDAMPLCEAIGGLRTDCIGNSGYVVIVAAAWSTGG